jgi:hypothetical protein
MRITPTAATEVLFKLSPLYLQWTAEAQAHSTAANNGSSNPNGYEHAYMFQGMKEKPIL